MQHRISTIKIYLGTFDFSFRSERLYFIISVFRFDEDGLAVAAEQIASHHVHDSCRVWAPCRPETVLYPAGRPRRLFGFAGRNLILHFGKWGQQNRSRHELPDCGVGRPPAARRQAATCSGHRVLFFFCFGAGEVVSAVSDSRRGRWFRVGVPAAACLA